MSLGVFIVLEGIDGAGTTTQMHRLTEALEGEGATVLPTFEPTDSRFGSQIRRFLRGEEPAPNPDTIALLFAADRLDHLEEQIRPALEAGTHVICDRYLGSSLAYQGSYSDPEWVRMINSHAQLPDVTLYFQVDVDTALARIGARDGEKRDLFEKKDALTRIAAAYDRVYAGSDPLLPSIVIDANASLSEVTRRCSAEVRRLTS